MHEERYLLSIEELLKQSEDLSPKEWESYVAKLSLKLDKERRNKVLTKKLPRKQAEALGAGLLLQYAVQEAVAGRCNPKSAVSKQKRVKEPIVCGDNSQEVSESEKLEQGNKPKDNICTILSFQEILEKIESPLPIVYTYGPQGKPYLQNYPFYFNLSHSGKYIFCAISSQEVGVDIQSMEGKPSERILQRFFAEEEKQAWEQCNTESERKSVFYRMWCRKEAYGKLTGEGVAGALGRNLLEKEEDKLSRFTWEEYVMEGQYQIAVCKRKV